MIVKECVLELRVAFYARSQLYISLEVGNADERLTSYRFSSLCFINHAF